MQKEKLITLMICLVFVITAGIIYVTGGTRKTGQSPVVHQTSAEGSADLSGISDGKYDSSGESHDRTADSGSSDDQKSDGAVSDTIVVYVCGAVKEPGLYELPAGSRINDAVVKAGGFKKKAARDYINLAEPLSDGEKVCILRKDQIGQGSQNTLNSGSVTFGTGRHYGDTGTYDSGSANGSSFDSGSANGSSSNSGSANSSSGKVNINTASKNELMTLTGIGESRAADIISYREENGAFKDIKDIMNVSGIKDRMFEKIKDDICV